MRQAAAVSTSWPAGVRTSHPLGRIAGSSSRSSWGGVAALTVQLTNPSGSTGVVGSSSSGTGSHRSSPSSIRLPIRASARRCLAIFEPAGQPSHKFELVVTVLAV